jgi:hypothetical protein
MAVMWRVAASNARGLFEIVEEKWRAAAMRRSTNNRAGENNKGGNNKVPGEISDLRQARGVPLPP